MKAIAARNSRRRALAMLPGAALALPRMVRAQSEARVPVVLLLTPGPTLAQRGLVDGLRALGYAPGRNLVVEQRTENLAAVADDLARHRVDVVFAASILAIRAARAATAIVPIVGLDLETDPVSAGLVASLARPGGNLTGLFLDQPGMVGKWLQMLVAVAPGLARVAVLWHAGMGPAQRAAFEQAAVGHGVRTAVASLSIDDLDRSLRQMLDGRPEALAFLSSPLVFQRSARLAAFALGSRLPSISMYREFVEAGGLMAYGPDPYAMARRGASLVDRILRGQHPAEIPVERPDRIPMFINRTTARTLGLKLPQSLLLQADRVID